MNNISKSYLEKGLPSYVSESISSLVQERAKGSLQIDCLEEELKSNLNIARVANQINDEQVTYIREKYL